MKEKQDRIKHANKTYCEGHAAEGNEICSWEHMPGWKSFLKGEIDESKLSDQAREEIESLSQTFSKFTRTDKEKEEKVAEAAAEDAVSMQRAKIASKIYRKACVDSGKNLCFFKNFDTWQEFVHGSMAEEEFYKKAMEEVKKAAGEQ